ncbi:MAG: SCO family protein [Thermogutta sp.]|nr:SCO family protein [Thermogutta sp.]
MTSNLQHARRRFVIASAACCAASIIAAASVQAQVAETAPDQMEGVGVEEHLDRPLPLDLEFVSAEGKNVRLGDYFDGKLPVILTLNYSNCPKLCHLQLNGLFEGLERLDWPMGEKYRVVTISINPEETVDRAAATKAKYQKTYRVPGSENWVFLTGGEQNIRKAADAVGFFYRYDPVEKQYVHVAVIMVCTPDGRLSRYLYGVEYPAQTLRLALLEAGEGKIGTTVDRILMFCMHFDPTRGSYAPAAWRLMQLGAALTLAVFGVVLGAWWVRDHRRSPPPAEGTTPVPSDRRGGGRATPTLSENRDDADSERE